MRLADLAASARPVLVDRTLAEAIAAWRDEVDVVRASPGDALANDDGSPSDDASSTSGLLLRPDGYVASASTSSDPTLTDRAALRSTARR